MRLSVFTFLLVALLVPCDLFAQKINDAYRLKIHRTAAPVIIDGVLDEAGWQAAEVATDFYMVLPMDTSRAAVRTEVRMTYDHHHVYLSAVCYHALPGRYIVESLKRDFVFGKNDNFLVFIDTYNDLTNGFSFGANAAGAQWDGVMYEGSRVDLSWDNKWESAVRNEDDRYVVEMAIPFKTIRYKKGITTWGINFSRLDLKTTEKSSWTPIPRQFPTASLAYTGVLEWDEAPPQAGSNISLIPYVLGGGTRDFEQDEATAYRSEIGGDAKIAITSSLNLDLTVNPDFSQVDVDDQVINLDRFELFFPEKRQFFLENGDLFANFGYENLRPFFSRRIGLGVPIDFGARLSGKLDKNWRIGALDMQTAAIDSTGLPAQNFAVFALQRKVFARSNIGLIFINKESLNYEVPQDPEAPVYSAYNRNLGLEYNLASANNFWTGKAFVFKSMQPGKSGEDVAHAANVRYATKRWSASWRHEYVGADYRAEAGYVPRQDYVRFQPGVGHTFFPNSKRVLSHLISFNASAYFTTAMQDTDWQASFDYLMTFRNQAWLNVWTSDTYIRLLAPFDPTNTGGDTLATGSSYRWKTVGAEFNAKPQSVFTYGMGAQYGGYYGGTQFRVVTRLGYRVQPYLSMGITATYTDLVLPEPMENTTLWLVGPRVDFTLTNKVFFTAFAQYNEQQDNVNLNTRFQWRYRPASDLFIVYTDNYLPGGTVKNRSLVLKFTYWWNI